MSDEDLRRLEREDFPRYRAALLRVGRLEEAGLATGDMVSVFQNVEVVGASGEPRTGHIVYENTVGGDRYYLIDFEYHQRLLPSKDDGVKLLQTGPGQREDLVPDEWGSAALHDALVIHFSEHPGLGEIPLETPREAPSPTDEGLRVFGIRAYARSEPLYRTSFDPRTDCEWCSKGERVIDLRNKIQRTTTPDGMRGLWHLGYSDPLPPVMDYASFEREIQQAQPAHEVQPRNRKEQREANGRKRTRENVRRRPPRRI